MRSLQKAWSLASRPPSPCDEWFAASPVPRCWGKLCHVGSLHRASKALQSLPLVLRTHPITSCSQSRPTGKLPLQALPAPVGNSRLLERLPGACCQHSSFLKMLYTGPRLIGMAGAGPGKVDLPCMTDPLQRAISHPAHVACSVSLLGHDPDASPGTSCLCAVSMCRPCPSCDPCSERFSEMDMYPVSAVYQIVSRPASMRGHRSPAKLGLDIQFEGLELVAEMSCWSRSA